MSKDWVQDISDMHEKYRVRPAVEKMNSDMEKILNWINKI